MAKRRTRPPRRWLGTRPNTFPISAAAAADMSDAAHIPTPEEPKMETHKPKSWPAWRVVLTDFVIVALGVGVALAAQQAADWWRWKNDVAQAREVIASETALNLGNTILRIRSAPCIERRLDQVTDILDAAARTGSLPPVGNIGQAPALAWPRGAWDNVISSQTASHFPRQLLVDFACLYMAVERAESFNVMEREAW